MTVASGNRRRVSASAASSAISRAPEVADHDGVDYHVCRVPGAQAVGDDFDNLDRRNHANLDGVGADIVKNGVNLRGYDIWRDILHGGNAQCVLRCDGGDGRLGIQAVRRDGLDVGLNAGATAGIGSRDGQDGRYLTTIHVRSLVRSESNGSLSQHYKDARADSMPNPGGRCNLYANVSKCSHVNNRQAPARRQKRPRR